MKILYILMRNDLSNMNAGRAMAQASHASNQFVHQFGISPDVKAWQSETQYGFGTAIILSASMDEINGIRVSSTDSDIICRIVEDPEYGYKLPNDVANLIAGGPQVSKSTEDGSSHTTVYVNQVTCAFVFGEKENCQKIIGHLKLHP